MIRAATPGDEGLVLGLCGLAGAPALGARAEADWRLLAENPRLPYRFFVVGDAGNKAVLEACGPDASLLGAVADGVDEIQLFLNFLGVKKLLGGTPLPGWTPENLTVMVHSACTPPASASPPTLPDGFAPDTAPSPREAALLLQEAGRLAPEDADDFYAGLCTRLNHGFARLWGARQKQGGKLAAIALLHSITRRQAYLTAVETLPAAQGKGCASALVGNLCASAAPLPVALLCAAGTTDFYQRLGFAPCGTVLSQSL